MFESPTMLSHESIVATEPKPDANWSDEYRHLEARMGMMRSWRYSWWAFWAVLAEYLLPRRYHWLVVANKMSRGRNINDAIVDGSPTLAMGICAAGLWSGLTSPSRPWFKVSAGQYANMLNADGKAWMELVEKKLYEVLSNSNFYNIMAQAFQDVATFGTAPVIIYEDYEDIIRGYLPCAGEYYLSCGARLSVDTLYREFTLTTLQIVEQFGLDQCPNQVRTAWENGGASLELEFVVAHGIEPNFPILKSGTTSQKVTPVPASFPYRETYWLKGIKASRPLSRRGFHELPFMAARWSVVSNDPYGRSPGMDAIGDTKQLQQETRRKGEFIEKMVRPPMGADPELKNEPSSIIPGNITYVTSQNGKKGFWPLFEIRPEGLPAIVNDLEKIEQRIERFFYVDVFLAISRMEGVQPRNELELTQRNLERLQVLGPFISLFETEFAEPALRRVMAIMQRRGILPPKPQSMGNIPIKIEFVSIMRLAQRSAEGVAMKDTLQTAGALSSAAQAARQPDPIRIFDLDKALRAYADINNFPSEALRSEADVKKLDQAAATAKARQDAMATSMAGVQAAKTLSETSTGAGTALGALLSHGGGTPINPSGGGQ